MPADIRVGLRLTADAKGLVGEVRASRKQIEQLTRAMGWGEAPTRGYARATAEVERSTRHTGRSLLAAHGALLHYAAGSIPAWAGEPHAASGCRCSGAVHPRVGGGAVVADQVRIKGVLGRAPAEVLGPGVVAPRVLVHVGAPAGRDRIVRIDLERHAAKGRGEKLITPCHRGRFRP